MKKRVFLIICILSFLNSNSYAQINSIESFDGKTYTKGDTIIGAGSLMGVYIMVRELHEGKRLIAYKENLEFNKLLINGITTENEVHKTNLDDTLAIVTNLSNNKTLYVSLKNALRRKEIIAEPAVRLYPDAPMATIPDFQIRCIKTNDLDINDLRVKYYIKSIDKKLGEKCERDEFEFHEVKDKYKAEIEDKIKNIDFNQIYYFDQPIIIEKYDFEKKGFPISFFKQYGKRYLEYGDFYCSIPNHESLSLFSIDPNQAKRANKLRSGNSDYPSTLVYARCYFRFLDQKMEIKKLKEDFFSDPEEKYRSGMVGMEIVGMEFYTESHANYNFLGSMKAE